MTIHVAVLFFANLREYAGLKMVELDLPAGTTMRHLKDLLEEKFPGLEKAKRSMIAAVNREYASEDHVLASGEEVAFFPPVSGG